MKVGIDLIYIERFKGIFSRNYKSWNSIFTRKEWDYIFSRPSKEQTLAGIFAAKEAVAKACLFNNIYDLGKIEINHNKFGIPYVKINNKKRIISISIAHDRNYAIAIAITK